MTDKPQTREQWQKAVDAATGLKVIADCKLYGLLKGGPYINVDRCAEIVRRGEVLNVHPSKPKTELAIELIETINAEAQEK